MEYCNQTGLTVAVWVAFRQTYTTQGLIEFGSGACGLNLARTNDSEMNATIRSMELGKTWSVQSVNASIGAGAWHHVALTWNFTGEVYLFINGTRYNLVFTAKCFDLTKLTRCSGQRSNKHENNDY